MLSVLPHNDRVVDHSQEEAHISISVNSSEQFLQRDFAPDCYIAPSFLLKLRITEGDLDYDIFTNVKFAV